MNTAYPVFVVNLDSDVNRYAALNQNIKGSALELSRVPAIRGRSLPDAALHFIPGANVSEKGTLGCFLSHVRAWQSIIESDLSGAIILEDDAKIDITQLGHLPNIFSAGIDLIFINNRMSLLNATSKTIFSNALSVMTSRSHTDQMACGGDGYFLSKNGAQALLECVKEKGFWGDVDWFILYAALRMEDISKTDLNTQFRNKLNFMNQKYALGEPLLSVTCLTIPIVHHGKFRSSRLIEDRASRTT